MAYWAERGGTAPAGAGAQPLQGAGAALFVLFLINLLNYYDRMLIVVVSQPLRLEFGLTDTQYGALTGLAFVFVYALASLVFGALADRYNRRTVIAVALTLWSVMTALCGLARSFGVLALGRAGVGVGEGGANPAGMSLLSDYYPPHRRSMALAVFASGGMVGLFLSFVLGSWIATHHGWRAVFLVAGIPGLLIAGLTLIMIREPKRGSFDRVAAEQLSYGQALGRLAGNKAYVWLCVAASLGVFSSLGMLIWLPQFFIRSHGMSVQEVGFLFGPAAALGLCAGMMAGGWIGNAYARRSLAHPVLICIFANLALAPLFGIVLWTASTPLALVVTFIAMASAVIYAPAFQASMQTVCEPEVRATGAAVSNVLNAIIGQGALPFLVGVLSDAFKPGFGAEALRWSLTVVAPTFAVLSGLGFIIALGATRRHFATP